MKAVLVKVGEPHKVIDVENDLKAIQRMVGGFIEVVPYNAPTHGIFIVCDEEGKRKKKKPNRLVVVRNRVVDVIAGDFVLVGRDGEEFIDLTPEQLKYIDRTISAGRLFY